MPKSLHPIDVSGARKDVKAPRQETRELQWLYGMWLARGGVNPRGIYFSIPKSRPDVVNSVTKIAFYQFNLHAKLTDHSIGKYRIYFNSRAIKNWWAQLELEPNQNSAVGILDASSWSKSSHLIVTCRTSKVEDLTHHLSTIHENLNIKCRENKNSCDIYLSGYLD